MYGYMFWLNLSLFQKKRWFLLIGKDSYLHCKIFQSCPYVLRTLRFVRKGWKPRLKPNDWRDFVFCMILYQSNDLPFIFYVNLQCIPICHLFEFLTLLPSPASSTLSIIFVVLKPVFYSLLLTVKYFYYNLFFISTVSRFTNRFFRVTLVSF